MLTVLLYIILVPIAAVVVVWTVFMIGSLLMVWFSYEAAKTGLELAAAQRELRELQELQNSAKSV